MTYFYTDPQGTPLAEADASGNIARRYEYSPYGHPVASFGSGPQGPGYAGHVNDRETGFVYMQARYEDTETGRFINVDPSPPNAGNNFSFNRYSYANNNPTSNVDRDGRNAVITYKADGNINVSVPVNFSGAGATAGNIASIKADVASRWTGVYNIEGQLTKINVAVVDVGKSTPRQAINNITLLTGPTSDKSSQGASFVRGGTSGEWNMASRGMSEGEAAHETGHLMRDHDYYVNGFDSNGSRTSSAMPAYSNNLMGALGGSVFTDSRNMNVILNDPNNVVEREPATQIPATP